MCPYLGRWHSINDTIQLIHKLHYNILIHKKIIPVCSGPWESGAQARLGQQSISSVYIAENGKLKIKLIAVKLFFALVEIGCQKKNRTERNGFAGLVIAPPVGSL